MQPMFTVTLVLLVRWSIQVVCGCRPGDNVWLFVSLPAHDPSCKRVYNRSFFFKGMAFPGPHCLSVALVATLCLSGGSGN